MKTRTEKLESSRKEGKAENYIARRSSLVEFRWRIVWIFRWFVREIWRDGSYATRISYSLAETGNEYGLKHV